MKTRVANASLADLLDRHTTDAAPELCRAEGDRIRCLACGHRCLLGPGLRGICKVRFNDGGQLKVPTGYVAGLQCDPVEKKPFFHVFPGSDALTFGMMGCDLHCSYCQNWLTSQALRDTNAVAPIRPVTPRQLVDYAQRERARLVVSSYNEPLITADWAVSVFRQAKPAGLACAFVSNGNATPEVLDFLAPWIVAYKVDLKSFDDRNYRSLGGTLQTIKQTIAMVHQRGLWLEVVTLIVPGFNDSADELRQLARFLASVSPDIPWHVTAFHQDYRMNDPEATPAATLVRAAQIGTAEGLRFVYAGNLPGRVGPWENTRCPCCRTTLIERHGYLIGDYRLTPDGKCPECQTRLPGIWSEASEQKVGAACGGRLPRLLPLPVVEVPGASLERAPARAAEPQPPGEVSMSAAQSVARGRSDATGRPTLSAEQQRQLVDAAVQMLHAAVHGQQPAFPAELAQLHEQPIRGAFVSLKRGRHLRGCSGLLGDLMPLRQALETAVARTAWDDVRFPPVSPTELEHLEVEVWLLHSSQQVQAQGAERLREIAVGKHGVRVVQGEAHGLFLPSVAVDNEWDAGRLLDQVCIKAGLAPTAWREATTALFTFEGDVVRGPVSRRASSSASAGRISALAQPEKLAAYAEFCRANLGALLAGATPSYYLWGAADGTVNGVVLSVLGPGDQAQHLQQISLRPGVPLQATLFALTQIAAQSLAARRLGPDQLAEVRIGLSLLHDPAVHGTVADPHLGGFEPRHRCLLITERNKGALVFAPDQPPAEAVAAGARAAQVARPEAAAVYSLDVLSDAAGFTIANVPRPVRGPAVRRPTAAGSFYDAEPEALARTVDQLLAGERRAAAWPAALVPHAGLRFSGRIAALVLQRLQLPRTIIVISPKHTPLGVDWAVAPHQTWELPGGRLESDFMLARQLCQAIPGLEMDAAAHQREHGIEVQLPLLARLAPESRVLGVVVGQGDLQACFRFALGLAGLLRQRKDRPLLLVSSDMNHFASDPENRRLDALALAALKTCDPTKLYETVTQNNISMCGLLPAVIVLQTLHLLGSLTRAEQVGYATTADVTGDQSRVVGYAGMLFG